MAAKREPNSVETTPSGIEIKYWGKVGLDGENQRRRYTINGEKATNVTSLTGQLDKPAMLRAAVRLTNEGKDYEAVWNERSTQGTVTHDRIINAITEGKSPPEMDGWTKAGFNWFMESSVWGEGDLRVLDSEVMVASERHGYAGRFDLLCLFPGGLDLPYCKADPGTIGRIDFKTRGEWKHDRKGLVYPPYDEHFWQLELYELAAIESGYPSSDFRAVVALGPDGEWEMWESCATPADVLVLLDLWHMRASMKERQKVAVA